MAGCNVFTPCYFSAGANTLHPERGEALTDPIQTARFVCKAEHVQELTDTLPHMTQQSPLDGTRAVIQGNLTAIEAGQRPAVLHRPVNRPYTP